MVIAVGIWSIRLSPKETRRVRMPSDTRVTNVALAEDLKDEHGRTSIRLVYVPVEAQPIGDDVEPAEGIDPVQSTILCSLTPGKIEQASLDLILEEDQEYLFESTGKNAVYICGNYIDQVLPDQAPTGDDFDDLDSDEEAFDLDEVSSDVEIDPLEIELPSDDEDEGRFEEVEDDEDEMEVATVTVSKKRARESDASEAEPQLSKAETKKLKKLKAEGGKAVSVGEEGSKANGEKKDKKEKKEEKKEKKEKEKEEKKEKKEEKKEKEKPSKDVASPSKIEVTLSGGLKYTDMSIGTGPEAKKGDRLKMRYIGKLTDRSVFDKNTNGKPFAFRLGQGEVIKGWDLGIAGMRAGGERLVIVPAALAYGKKSQPGIPGNSTLIFEVKLLSIN